MNLRCLSLLALCSLFVALARAQQAEVQASFRIKYVMEDAVYVDGGRNVGLARGMKLTVKRQVETGAKGALKTIAEMEVTSLGNASAVCEVRSATEAIQVGDLAYLSPQDEQALKGRERGPSNAPRYAQVVSFTGDPLEEELDERRPRPRSPEINRIRGRIGTEYNVIRSRGDSGPRTLEAGLVLRVDMSRIGGTYWNFSGYWRGRMNSRSGGFQQTTLRDLINRTYHLSLTYSNPNSRWVAGVGRLYLPWASSLSTIDGGYFGRRFGKRTTLGLFGGSTPDPTAWNYNPDRQIAGTFANFELGTFDSARYSSTAGVAVTRINGSPERQFAFFENGLFYKRYLFIHHSMETDVLKRSSQGGDTGPVVSRSYFTLRVQPHRIISFDISHNYFRQLPTFDPRLVGTGLVDKLLFQGLSGGFRLELPYRVSFYSSLGRSHRTGDSRNSWNQLYGITVGQIWRTGVRADLRYSKFNSSFGYGSYRSFTLMKELSETLRFEVQGGQQDFSSPLTNRNGARWVNTTLDWFLGTHYFLGSGFTVYRGDTQGYDQWFLNLGYRF